MRKLMLLLAVSAFIMLEIHADSPADNNQKKPAKQAPKPKVLSRSQRIAKLRKEEPFVQAKTGDTVSCLLLSDSVITGKIYRIQPDAVWIDDGTVKLRQKRNLLSMETRAKFWREDYNLYTAELIDKEIFQESLAKNKGKSTNVADKRDPKFKRPPMNLGNKLKKKK